MTALVGCNKNTPKEKESAKDFVLNVSADAEPLRMAMNWDETARELQYKWRAGDEIFVYYVSTDDKPVVKELPTVTLAADNVAADAKTCSFSVTVPASVHNGKSFKLYLSLAPLEIAKEVFFGSTYNLNMYFTKESSKHDNIYLAPIEDVRRVGRYGSLSIDPAAPQAKYYVKFDQYGVFVVMNARSEVGDVSMDYVKIEGGSSLWKNTQLVKVVSNVNKEGSELVDRSSEDNPNSKVPVTIGATSKKLAGWFFPNGAITNVSVEVQNHALGASEQPRASKTVTAFTPEAGKFYKLPNLVVTSASTVAFE